MGSQRIYLDHAATTPVLPEAREAMVEAMERWANPSSPHAEGRSAKAALEDARTRIKEALDWPHDLIFTSGASEAVGIVARGCVLRRRLVGATEHEVVPCLMGEEATLLPVRGDGQVDTDCLDAALAGEPALVAVQQVNNETGIIQSLEQVSARVRASGGLLLADCAQGAGKIPLPDADFIAISAHKFGGPPGIGALLVKDLGTLAATGGQEKGYRRGTQNLPAAVAMAAALASKTHRQAQPRLAGLRNHLEGGIVAAGGLIVGGGAAQLPSILAVSLPGASREALLIQLDLAGFAVSIGPACSSGRMTGSRVLTAMSLPEDVVGGAIRVSLGPQTSEQDVEAFLNAFTAIASRARAA